jgi:hypothetical protein
MQYNEPEYILVDVLKEVVAAVREVLQLPVLNYQYGYVTELNTMLQQYAASTPEYQAQRFPLVWVRQPFAIKRAWEGFYGTIDDLGIFIMQESEATLTAEERMNKTFKPVIYPIYRELMRQLNLHPAIVYSLSGRRHTFIDRYWWGEIQEAVISDIVDCSELSQVEIQLHNNPNSTTFKSF